MALPKELLTFSCIGLVNTAVDLMVFFSAIALLEAGNTAANIIAWFVAVPLSYALNSYLTFGKPLNLLNLSDLIKFMLSGVAGLVVATITLLALSSFTGVIVAKLASILVGLVFNFTLAKYFVFNTTRST